MKISQPKLAEKLNVSRNTIYDRLKEFKSLDNFLDRELKISNNY